MPDAIGVTPERAQQILDLPIVGAETTIEGGVTVFTSANGDRHLTGKIAQKLLLQLGSFDCPTFEVVSPEWALPFMDNPSLPSPSLLPQGGAAGVTWSPDGLYLGYHGSGYQPPPMHWYKRNGYVLTRLTSVASPITGTGAGPGMAWSPNGQHLLCNGNQTKVGCYKRTGDTIAALPLLPNHDLGGSSQAQGLCWSPDGVYAIVFGTGPPYFNQYSRAGDTFTKMANTADQPVGTCYGVSWSPNGQYVAFAHETTPFLTIYKVGVGGSLTKIASPTTPPAARGTGVAWTSDSKYLAVSHVTSPFVSVYKRSGDAFVKINNPASLPSGNASGVAWSPDSAYLAVVNSASPYLTVYRRIGDSLYRMPTPSVLPPNSPTGQLSWTPDGQILTIGLGSSPFLISYRAASDIYGGAPTRTLPT